MSGVSILLITIIPYVVCARLSLSIPSPRVKSWCFASINILTFIFLVVALNSPLSAGLRDRSGYILFACIYIFLIVLGFIAMKMLSERESQTAWFAFLFPVLVLVAVKYLSFIWSPMLAKLDVSFSVVASTMVGISYMAFRLSYLVIEVRNQSVPKPTLSEYLGFAFFLPTIVVGPINRYRTHRNSFLAFDRSAMPIGRCLLRVLVGATKYQFLGNLANQLAYGGIFLDGKPHGFFDLGVSIIFYYLYLYCNFSGFCDMAIGLAGLIGIKVEENFDNPFAARNIKEFWNRWHITLSNYVKDVVFSPVSKGLARRLGSKHLNLSINVSVLLVFSVVGVWHGVGWRYLLFGLIHGLGIIANNYYTIWLKRRLGKDRFKVYNESRLVNVAATICTFAYVAVSFAVFANDNYMMRVIGHGMRTGLYVR